jgi:hypothetical protein
MIISGLFFEQECCKNSRFNYIYQSKSNRILNNRDMLLVFLDEGIYIQN